MRRLSSLPVCGLKRPEVPGLKYTGVMRGGAVAALFLYPRQSFCRNAPSYGTDRGVRKGSSVSVCNGLIR